ncbi:MAG TPA: hypothetical protein VH417_04070 [Vicinamibacterales bacterium]|jgi:DNA-binding response OmpR family regulator
MPDPAPVFRFGPFRLDVAERRLSRNDEVLPLRLKVFETLRVLVENPGRLLTKEDASRFRTRQPDLASLVGSVVTSSHGAAL